MVGTIKKWLGIDVLERENRARADEILILTDRLKRIDNSVAEALASASDMLSRVNSLTPEPAKPKIVAVPQRVNWKQFRTAAERASEPEREEA
jgi:hypothetical protein